MLNLRSSFAAAALFAVLSAVQVHPVLAQTASYRLNITVPVIGFSDDGSEPEASEPLEIFPGQAMGSINTTDTWSYQASATGGRAPLVWSVVQHDAGGTFSIDPDTGLLSGSSLFPGVYDFTVSVTDADGAVKSADVSATFITPTAVAYSPSYIVGVETNGVTVGGPDAMSVLTDNSDTTYVSLATGGFITYRFDRMVNVVKIPSRWVSPSCGTGFRYLRYILGQNGEKLSAGSVEGGAPCGAVAAKDLEIYKQGYGVHFEFVYVTPGEIRYTLIK